MKPVEIVLIGSGNMAEAILKGICHTYPVEVVSRNEKRLQALRERYGEKIGYRQLQEAVDLTGKVVIMAVKPYALADVSQKVQGRALAHLSVLAGVTLDSLKAHIDATYTIRAMPNLAASHGKSMTTLHGDEAFREEAMAICRSFGKALWLGSEKEIDIATAIAGSGPAYLALVAEALADGGVKMGLKRADARMLAEGLFEGMGALLQEHPALLKDAVMSPGGTTAAGYGALEAHGVRDAFIQAVTAAAERAEALGKK